jgi:hypothetical protein
MPEPYELFICYNGTDEHYMDKLQLLWAKDASVIFGDGSRFRLINEALDDAEGDYFMHLENDFYWQDPRALDEALNALHQYPEIDYIRFEYLPFTKKVFNRTEQVGERGIHWMKDDAPYRFTFNPHIRREKFPCGRFQEKGFTKQPEQHHNDNYDGVSCCMDGENFRHLGIYDEGGNYKPYYAERFTLRRGEREIKNALEEFYAFCDNYYYRQLFMRYLHDNRNKHNKKRN